MKIKDILKDLEQYGKVYTDSADDPYSVNFVIKGKYVFQIVNLGYLKEMMPDLIDYPEGTPYAITLSESKDPTFRVQQHVSNVEEIVPTIEQMKKDFL